MGIRFNADEVMAVAVRIEDNGVAFYRRAAELRLSAGHEDEAGFLQELAETEDRHRATFSAMREKLAGSAREETAYDPYMEAELFLEDLADGHGGEGSPSAARALTGGESMADILRTAIELERKSILFYLGLKPMVPVKLGREHVEAIIEEEKQHLAVLAGELKRQPES